MNLRKVTTQSSIWTFDLDAKMFWRVPRSESPAHPGLQYETVGQPEPYESVEYLKPGDEFWAYAYCGPEEPRLKVVFPEGVIKRGVMRGKDEYSCLSGVIEHDTHPESVSADAT